MNKASTVSQSRPLALVSGQWKTGSPYPRSITYAAFSAPHLLNSSHGGSSSDLLACSRICEKNQWANHSSSRIIRRDFVFAPGSHMKELKGKHKRGNRRASRKSQEYRILPTLNHEVNIPKQFRGDRLLPRSD
ncbi:hypothetical protein RRG08_022534 [Elysia crispata]|uniref:Uncharacterized protein n=1 Tax=Elysia crispata TaxID=231223 RepID=A0AAE1D8Y4_9GAST|nr:hypothetical protein RRG08_022534 [Elysia crispata]